MQFVTTGFQGGGWDGDEGESERERERGRGAFLLEYLYEPGREGKVVESSSRLMEGVSNDEVDTAMR